MSHAAVGGLVMSLILGFLGFVLGAALLRVIMLRHIERQLAAILKEPRTRTTAAAIAEVAIILCAVGCAGTTTFNVPTVDPKTPPTVVLDVQNPPGPIFTFTSAGPNPAMPVQLSGNDEVSLVALCTDNDGGCRNIQIFADATTNNADGSVVTAALGMPVAENLDANATPGGTASQQRNASTKLIVSQLRGNFAGLKLDISARATNAHNESASTGTVSLFWSRQVPLTLPSCARFTPIGSNPPVVLDSRAVTVAIQNAKAAAPTQTTFIIGVRHPTDPTTGWRLTVAETNLPPTTAVFRFENSTGSDKELLTVDGRNCNAPGKLLVANATSATLEAIVNSSDTTTILLSNPNMVDVAVWNEGTFWPAFGGKRTTITWIH